VYRSLRRQPASHIVELGIGDIQRSRRMIEFIRRHDPAAEVWYAAIDPFESRPAQQVRLVLKDTFRQLSAAGAKVRLIPGEPLEAMQRYANALTGIDLLIISADVSAKPLGMSWFFVPRMLTKTARVFVEVRSGSGQTNFQTLSYEDVTARANAAANTRRTVA
jgi:hypothetical protein